MLIRESSVSTKVGEAESKILLEPDGGVTSVMPWFHSVTIDTVPYNVLADKEALLGESYPVPAKQRTEIGGDLANRFEWKYFMRPNQQNKQKSQTPRIISKVGRRLRVNGENVLSLNTIERHHLRQRSLTTKPNL
ncbi:hypothetical protein WA026_013954 [Henosepilachna vigintioctopunctata]|uniref:Teneurin-like YD-shell domain-containing protein n=1 Tax=Henosepilachna vigintioctopunctata TaxID=420089 RepID=A0AAW1U108_9CUCU